MKIKDNYKSYILLRNAGRRDGCDGGIPGLF